MTKAAAAASGIRPSGNHALSMTSMTSMISMISMTCVNEWHSIGNQNLLKLVPLTANNARLKMDLEYIQTSVQSLFFDEDLI